MEQIWGRKGEASKFYLLFWQNSIRNIGFAGNLVAAGFQLIWSQQFPKLLQAFLR